MPGTPSRTWRQIRSGLAYLYYAVGAVGLLLCVEMRQWLRGRDPIAAQRMLSRGYASFVRVMQALDVIHVRTHGLEVLEGPGPRLVVANHPSLIDSALIVSRLPQADNFVSPEWARVPVIGRLATAVAALTSDAGPATVADAAARLRDGRSVVMFPEATRSPRDGLGRFHRGAAHVALASGCDLLPLVIRMDPPTTKKGQPWYDVPDRRPEVEIFALPPLSPSKVLDGTETPVLAARKVTAALREIYEKVLDRD